jgi:hypothetical protein
LLPSQADFGLCTVQIKNINSKTKECWEKKAPIIMKHVTFCRGRNGIFFKFFPPAYIVDSGVVPR